MSAHSVRSYVNRSVFVIAMLLVASIAWAVPGDINESGRVDGFDLMAFSRAYGTSSADTAWNPLADLNGDGSVDDGDLVILKKYFGIEGKTRGCWVLDIGTDRVVLLGSTSGNPVREYTFDSEPREMAYNPVADELWITFSSRELKIVGESENGTRVERTITGFPYPYHVDVDAINGGCWVTDTNLDDVYFIADDVPDGYDVATDQGFHRTVQGFSNITSLAVSAKDGSVWVGDASRNTVYKIERDVPDGYDITSRFDFHAFTTGFDSPDSLAVNGVTGDCWVADSYKHKVVRIASKGNQWLTTIDITSPVAVTVNPLDGTIHVGDNNRKEIVKYLKNGLIEGFRTPCVFPNHLSGEHVSGALWAAYNGTSPYADNSLLKISSAGNVLLSVKGYQPRRVIVVQETDPAMGKRPHALFSANATGLDVQFDAGASYDLDGQIIRYEWDFDGDGTFETTTSSEKVSHTYTLPGVYTPILKVTDNDWLTDTKSDVILQLGSFTVTAQVEPSNGTTMQTEFKFSGKGIDPAHGQIQNYKWDFDGDGQPDFFSEATASTSHSYAEPGKYTATLIAVNAQGESASADVQVEVFQAPPVIRDAYASPKSGNAPLRTGLQGVAEDSDGSIALFQWDFNGDGQFNWSNMGTGSVNTVFFDNGTYTPLFKVTDNSGLTAEQAASLVVNPMQATGVTPVARFSTDKVKDNAPATFIFDASGSSVSEGEIVSYAWNFGSWSWTAEGVSASHEYTAGGTYTVRLTITTDRGATASTSHKVTVREAGLPVALFAASKQEGLVPLAITFDASASKDNGTLASYDWNFAGLFFDDMESGTNGWQAEGKWALTTEDAYSGTHCWTDSPGGDYNSTAQTALVSPPFSIPAGVNAKLKFRHKFSFDPSYYYSSYAYVQISRDGGENWNQLNTFSGYGQDEWTDVEVNLASYAGRSNLKIRFYLDARGYTGDGWYIDDVTIDGGVVAYDTSGVVVSHTYTMPGVFNPILRVTDDEGNEDFFTVPIKAKTPPTATILDPTNLYDVSMRNILFSGTGSDTDGTIVLYEWDFNGDGIFDWSSENQGTTLHDLDMSGTYTAMFRVTDNDGLTGNATVAFNTVAMPPANLQAGVERTSRDTFSFTGFAQDDDGHIVKYEWDFDGDGNPDWGSAGPGKVVSFTSQYSTSSWAANNLIDGKIKASGSNGWSSTGAPVVPQEIVFELAGNQAWAVDALRVNPATTGGTDRWAKEIQVLVSSTGLRANDFFLVSENGTFVLANEDRFQTFSFDPVQARYVKLRVLSNYGYSAEVQLGEFDVLSGHLSLLSPLTASTSHQYATPGEYTAVLKATDDEGRVATIEAKSVKSLPDDQIQAAVSALPDPVATGQVISLRGFGVYDDFSNATTLGTQWTSPTGLNDWSIVDGQLRQSTNNGDGPEEQNYGRSVVAGNGTWQDYVLNAKIYSTDNDSIGLIVRYQNEGAYYLFEWNKESPYRRLLKRTANATEILAEDAVGYDYEQWYEINMDVQGPRIRVAVDGKQIFDVTDSSYSQGGIGLWTNYNSYTYFDDIYLTWPEISKYEWDFDGDGTFDWSSTTVGSVTHSYDVPGLFQPTFRLTDGSGRTETIEKSLEVVAAAATKPYAWVADKNHDTIIQVDAQGKNILKTVRGFNDAVSIDVNWKDGSIWVADYYNKRVVRLSGSVPDGYDVRYDRGHHALFSEHSDTYVHNPKALVVDQTTGDCTTIWNYGSRVFTAPANGTSRELSIPLVGTVDDSGPRENDAEVYGEYNSTACAVGNGLYLGDRSYLKLPDSAMDGLGDFTFEMWFKTPNAPTSNMPLISGAALNNDNAFLLDLYSQGTAIYLYAMGEGKKTFTIANVHDDQFHHLAFTRSNSTGTLYIDGVSAGSQTMTNASLTIDAGGLIIGQEQDQVGGKFDWNAQLKGWVDDIRIWSKALDGAEILTNKDQALTGNEAGLVGYWPCELVTPKQDDVRSVAGFSNPVAVDVYEVDHSIWVADSSNRKMYHVLANATRGYDVTTQSDSHFEWYGLSSPVGVAVDQNDGSCWVGDYGMDRVYKFDPLANKLFELKADARYVAVDQKDSSVWFNDNTSKEIFHCDGSGSKANSYIATNTNISSLAVDPDTGICWVTDIQQDALLRLSPGGGLLSELKGLYNPADVAVPSICLQNNPPVIDSASTDVSEGTGETLVTFSASVSDNTGVTFYQWDFNGDGRVDYSSATSGNTSHTYTEPGLYRPVLTVMDGEGNTSSTTLEPVIIGPGYATIEVDKSSGPASLTVKFTGSGFDPKGGMLEYAWDDDNDGTFEYVSQSFSKTFYDSGEYPVLLRVKGNSGYFYDEIVISVLSSPPTVSCSASPVSGEPPLVVNLKGSASDADGSLVLYQWDFEGDGIFDWSSSTSTEVNHVYTKAGMYTPVFRAVDDDGDMATAMKAIIVNSLPKAAFSLNATRGNAPMAVTAQASNASDVDGNIADYTWYLDGIQTSQGEQAVFSGLTAGIHTIKLKVVDAYGETSESQEQIEVLAAGMPIAVARVAEDEVMFPESVSLRGDASTANGTIVSHEWQYGLGYFLNANGYPTHQLLIGKWDSANCNDFSKHIPGLESRNPYPGSGVDGRIWIEAHDEDGNFDWNEKLGSSYNDFGYSHIYVYAQEEQNARILFGADDAARFWVNQELVYTKDACGGVVIDSHQADIFLKQGWNRILAQVVNGSGGWGLAYRLVDASDNPLHLPYSLVVPTGVPDYSGQGANLDHVYLPGRYTAELTVIDDQNNTDSNEVSFTVLPPDGGGVIEALVDPAEADAPFTAHFDATIDSSITPTLYEWDFDGDMVFDSSSTESVQTEHVFREKALINVTLHVRDSQGNDYYDSVEINAGGITPVAIPVAYPTTGTAPLRVKFSTNGYDADNTINRYEWDFNGDGIFDKFVTPGENLSGYPDYQPIAMTTEYTYHAPGTYNATLKVTDHDGYSSSANITIVVQAAEAPELALKADTTSGETPLTVNFRAEASASANSIAGYRWDFGEGSGFGDLQAESLVPHIYADPGIYTAQVMAVDDRSASATRDLTIFVLEDGAPEVSATASTDSGEGDLGVVLDAEVTSSDDDPITAYEWDFDGDGQYDWSSTDSPTVAHIYSDPGEYDAVLKTTTQSGKIGYDQLHIAVEPSFKVWRGRESFDPTLGETMPLTLATSMEMKLLEFNVIDRVGTLVKRLDVNKTVSPGIYNYTWDGRDTAGNIVGSGVFYFIARYEINGKVYEFDLTNSEGFDRQTYGDHTDGKNYQTSFNPFSGEPLDIRLELPKPAEVCIYVYDWNSKEDIRTILLREPMTSGSKVVQWDGAQDDGTLISSSTSYTMSMSYWILSDNAMIVQSRPQVSQLLTYPHYFNPSFNPYLEDPSLSIDFSLSKSSDVLVHIVDGFNTVVRVIEGKNLPAGANTLHWDGRNEKGLLPMPGFYRARIKAKDKAGNESIPFNSIFNLFY